MVVRKIRSRSELSERMEHIEENWKLYRPELFKHAVTSAALSLLLGSNGSSLCMFFTIKNFIHRSVLLWCKTRNCKMSTMWGSISDMLNM